MNEKVIGLQKKWLEDLTYLNKGRPLMGQYLEGRVDDFKKPWTELNRNDIIITRQILSLEVVFDFDYPTWKEVRSEAIKLLKYLNEAEIPHITATSGGKGIHVHVFLDPQSITIDEEKITEAAELGVDISKVIRKSVFYKIVENAKLKVANPKDRSGLDTSKVFFSNAGRGSLIREFGCPRTDGNVKSMIDDVIPKDKPAVKEAVFPNDIELVTLIKWYKRINDDLDNAIVAAESSMNNQINEINGCGNDIPCYRCLIGGVKQGSRNIGAFTIGRLGCLIGNPIEETKKDIKVFCKNSNYKEDEALMSIYSAYRYKENKTFCGTVVYNFGSEVCDKDNCPIEKERRKMMEQ